MNKKGYFLLLPESQPKIELRMPPLEALAVLAVLGLELLGAGADAGARGAAGSRLGERDLGVAFFKTSGVFFGVTDFLGVGFFSSGVAFLVSGVVPFLVSGVVPFLAGVGFLAGPFALLGVFAPVFLGVFFSSLVLPLFLPILQYRKRRR